MELSKENLLDEMEVKLNIKFHTIDNVEQDDNLE